MSDNEKPRFVLLDHSNPVKAYVHLLKHLRETQTAHILSTRAVRRVEARPFTPVPATEWGKQVQHAVTKDHGFTFHDHIGDGPKDGYMVSVDKDSEQVMPMLGLHPDQIADYRDMHQQELKDPENYLGGWVYKGKVYLDISHHVADQNQALALARQHQQLGVYDIGHGQTVMTPAQQQVENEKKAASLR